MERRFGSERQLVSDVARRPHKIGQEFRRHVTVRCGRNYIASPQHQNLRRFMPYAGPFSNMPGYIPLPADRNQVHGDLRSVFTKSAYLPVSEEANGASRAVLKNNRDVVREKRIAFLSGVEFRDGGRRSGALEHLSLVDHN